MQVCVFAGVQFKCLQVYRSVGRQVTGVKVTGVQVYFAQMHRWAGAQVCPFSSSSTPTNSTITTNHIDIISKFTPSKA